MINKFLCAFFLSCIVHSVFSLDLELTQGTNSALPVGINLFGTDPESQSLRKIIQDDLIFSGQFKVIQPVLNESISPPGYWQRAGADSVVSGKVTRLDGNRLDVRVDVRLPLGQSRALLSKRYQIEAVQLRALAHHLSDEIYHTLTGQLGIFSTRIAYILVHRSPNRTQYSLEIADMDGNNPRRLLESSEPIMSPTWSPDGRQLAYVSFEQKRSQIFSVEISSGRRRLLTSFTGINGAPAWSPDGRYLTVVLSKSGSPKLYSVDLSNGVMKQLTFGTAIDTEPRYSADGRFLLFTSGRGGSPQIYRLTLANGQITRLSFDGNYNARASYTPDQAFIVMLHREDKQFNIGVQARDQTQVTPLTNSQMDESPSVSPNGRWVLYATRYQNQGVLAMVSIDGNHQHRLPVRDGDIQEPAWSPFLG